MKPFALFGVLLYALGVAAVMYQGIAFATRKKKIADRGGLHLPPEKAGRLPFGPIAGGAALLSGTLILVLGLMNR
jgi:hypothetical protein